jgi:hypothetical protein
MRRYVEAVKYNLSLFYDHLNIIPYMHCQFRIQTTCNRWSLALPPLQKSLGAVAIKQNIKARRGYPVDLCMKLKAARFHSPKEKVGGFSQEQENLAGTGLCKEHD